jgi:small subunit ribosomal protein S9
MADKKSDKKSLSDLGELTSPKPEAPAVAEAPAEAAATIADAEAPAERAPASSGREGGRRDKEEAVNDHGVSTQGPQIEAVLREQQLDKFGRAYATGRR